MTIKFYPSRLPGEPLETHEHAVLTLHEWMCRNVRKRTA
ncbi:kinase [Klebsiella quasipneumoniae]|nr:kinase [Klebsiella quasipneumoniae]